MIISVKFNVKNNEDVIIILHLTIVLAVYDHKLTFLLARIAHHHFKWYYDFSALFQGDYVKKRKTPQPHTKLIIFLRNAIWFTH